MALSSWRSPSPAQIERLEKPGNQNSGSAADLLRFHSPFSVSQGHLRPVPTNAFVPTSICCLGGRDSLGK